MAAKQKLTDAIVKRLKPPEKGYTITLDTRPGASPSASPPRACGPSF